MSAPGEPPPPPPRATPATPVLDPGSGVATREMAPGAPRAVEQGCLCSVLANAAYRAHAEEHPFIDPECPVHRRRSSTG
jgi:hypothetical protein